jgi:hypothetical protein
MALVGERQPASGMFVFVVGVVLVRFARLAAAWLERDPGSCRYFNLAVWLAHAQSELVS